MGRVFWRFKYLMILGLLLAAGLAFISAARVNTSTWKVSYRGTQQWASYSKVFVTQKGFPWGAVNAPSTTDPTRFTSLALIYANLINGDAVTSRMNVHGKLPGTVEAATLLTSPGSSDALPIISIAGLSDTKAHSLVLTGRATTALLAYVDALQRQNGIPERQPRVVAGDPVTGPVEAPCRTVQDSAGHGLPRRPDCGRRAGTRSRERAAARPCGRAESRLGQCPCTPPSQRLRSRRREPVRVRASISGSAFSPSCSSPLWREQLTGSPIQRFPSSRSCSPQRSLRAPGSSRGGTSSSCSSW